MRNYVVICFPEVNGRFLENSAAFFVVQLKKCAVVRAFGMRILSRSRGIFMKSVFQAVTKSFALSIAVVLTWCTLAWAQAPYSGRPIKVVVPYPAGGTTDVVTRLYAKGLADALGQQFIVENRPGGGTNIGAEYVARSAPDGHTLFVVQVASHGINPSLFSKLSYDAVKDFAAVGFMARTAMFLIVNPSLPVNSVNELLNYARANPGKLNFASQGNGSPGHLAGALLKQRAGVDIVHVPYKGAAQAITDLSGGQVQFSFLSLDGTVASLVKEGKLKVLAVAAGKRWPTEPQIPSMSESGVSDFEALSFFGLAAPAGSPEPMLEKLNRLMVEMSKSEETRKRLAAMGLVPMTHTRAEMTAFIVNEIEKWRPIVKAAGAKID
jgi:tripartite-type tricarboxylate transporter receptor subunit TctC